jgi:hypothetical protein
MCSMIKFICPLEDIIQHVTFQCCLLIKSSIFWDIMLCTPPKVNQHFRTCFLWQCLLSASCWFPAWLIQPWRWIKEHYIAEYRTHDNHCCENIIFHMPTHNQWQCYHMIANATSTHSLFCCNFCLLKHPVLSITHLLFEEPSYFILMWRRITAEEMKYGGCWK